MNFLTDEMEGNLTRWLRFLGYNTRYAKDYESSYGSPVADDNYFNYSRQRNGE
ncbi:MAG: Mut7-C RNAse domain-containing protein [Promethearchaeota archaeon]